MTRLYLPDVTLCAAASVNVDATIRALEACLDRIEVADCLLFGATGMMNDHPRIRCVNIPKLESGADYSDFVLKRLVDFITTSHVLIAQWDGFVLDARMWDPQFLHCDYIGAPWPQFEDGNEVGNGGFSLRSRRLMEACRDPRFQAGHPEDVAICRTNRQLLEDKGMRFASADLASKFSFERGHTSEPTFGFHGIFNVIPLLGADQFWEIYRRLDDRGTAAVDFELLFRQLGTGPDKTRRRIRLAFDFLTALIRR